MTQLYRVLYCSRNHLTGMPETYPAEIRGILATSRKNNARDGVTGGLLFSEGCFAQVLEGPLEMIEGAFERIQCDERHRKVTVLQSGSIAARDFPDWSMAFTAADVADNPLADAALSGAFSGQSSAGDDILNLMRKVIVREDWLAPA
jgi:Sensors of blue-light using FAD